VQRRWYWKAYFFLSASMMALAIGFYLYPGYETAPSDIVAEWVSLPFYVVQLLGLYGFIYWRRFGHERPWRLVFAATVIEDIWTVYSFWSDLPDVQSEAGLFAIMVVTATALMAPALVALFIYAFRSPRLWAEDSRA
jgi:hypothetical protein